MTRDQIDPALHGTLDALAENSHQQRVLFNPDPGINSAVERVLALRTYGVPDSKLRELLSDLREALLSNHRERHGETTAVAILDRLALQAHATGARAQITILALARELRPLLRDAVQTDTPRALIALRRITKLADRYGSSKLLAPSMRNQLGNGRYRLLTELLERSAA